MNLIIDDESCEVSECAIDLILRQTRDYAKPGVAYAVKKGNTVELLREGQSTAGYERRGFEVFRK